MSKLITLTTDFGNRDYFVGAMKGVILSISPNAQIVDLTHEIAPQNIFSGAFTLFNAAKEFPAETIHVCVVDPGVGSKRRPILLATEKHFFVAPDNGVLSFVLENETKFRVFELTDEKFFRQPLSRTFHGRDLFAPVAAHLANGVKPQEFGAEVFDFAHLSLAKPEKVGGSTISARILHIDHFGNLITNLRREDLPERFALEINGVRIEKLQNFFAEAEQGKLGLIFGSAGYLEIAANCDSAKEMLKAEIGQQVKMERL